MLQFFAERYTEEFTPKYLDSLQAITSSRSLVKLAATPMFLADTDKKKAILSHSIATLFALGGEVGGGPGSGMFLLRVLKRSLPAGVSTAEQFVAYLHNRTADLFRDGSEKYRQAEAVLDECRPEFDRLVRAYGIEEGVAPHQGYDHPFVEKGYAALLCALRWPRF